MLNSRTFLFIVACSLQLTISPLKAEHLSEVVPESIPGIKTMTAELLIELAQIDDDLILIDSRLLEDRFMGYIGTSVSLPFFETNCSTLQRITPDLYRPLLFYCNGAQCGGSLNAAKIALSCNYQSLYWFKGGFKEWMVKDYPYMLE